MEVMSLQVLSFGDTEGPEGVTLTMRSTGQLFDVANELVTIAALIMFASCYELTTSDKS